MPTIQDGRSAIDSGNLQQARLIFEAILQENPRSEDAWLGLADVLTETNDKRICYENVLKINKSNSAARQGLRDLEPEEDPLVAAMRQQTAPPISEEGYEEDYAPDEFDEDSIMIGDEMMGAETDTSEGDSTPTPILIAVGLGLSVVVFALAGGLIFFLLTSLTG